MKKLLGVAMALALFLSLASGCAAPGSTPSGTTPGTGTQRSGQNPSTSSAGTSTQSGQVQIIFTDAPRTDNVSSVEVTISNIQIHEAGSGAAYSENETGSDNETEGESDNQTSEDDGGWISTNITDTFNLLDFANGLQKDLGTVSLPSGNYTQVRLTVDNVSVTNDGKTQEAKVPSGTLKFVEPFEVVGGQITGLLFDFNAQKSIVMTGNGDFIVKPVIKLTPQKPREDRPESQTNQPRETGTQGSDQHGASSHGQNSDQSGSSPHGQTSGQSGQVQIIFTDAPRTDNVSSVMVAISNIQMHEAGSGSANSENETGSDNETEGESDNQSTQDNGGWISTNITGNFDLLKLHNVQQILGSANLTSGYYTQIRLTVDNVSVTVGGNQTQAKIPSGTIKFVEPFQVVSGNITGLLFDFNAEKSIIITGNGDIIVKPVIKLTVQEPNTRHPQGQNGPSLRILPQSLPNGTDNVSYNATPRAMGGTGPYLWTISDGALPGGLTIDPNTGTIAGTANETGTFTFTVTVTDNSTPQQSATSQYTITILSDNSSNKGEQEREQHFHD